MPPEQPKKPKILLVEDDLFMVDLLGKELTEGGFDMVIANNGKEGVEKFQESKPDLVVLDLILPDQNGFETLRQIRRTPDGPQAKVIVLSNIAESLDIEEAKRLGVVNYFVKANTSLTEIVEKARAILGT